MVGYRGASYLTESGIEATRKYWRDLLQGLIEIEAPLDAVLAWELVNEQWMFNSEPPLSLSSGTISTLTGEYDLSDRDEKQAMVIDGLRYYISEVREEILSHDPTALVTMGFFAPNYPHWDIVADIDWYVDTAPLVEESDLDFLDFHVYMGGDLTLREYAENFGMIGYWDRPIILGEFGANRGDYSTITWAGLEFIRIMRETCNLGFQGWLFWTNRTNDDFWVFSDQDGYLQDLLSPANLGDPCE
jgi:hypothetical protein